MGPVDLDKAGPRKGDRQGGATTVERWPDYTDIAGAPPEWRVGIYSAVRLKITCPLPTTTFPAFFLAVNDAAVQLHQFQRVAHHLRPAVVHPVRAGGPHGMIDGS